MERPSASEIRAAAGADPRAARRRRRGSSRPTSDARARSARRRGRGLRDAADMRHGGFGGAPKFPPASALELLLARGEHATSSSSRSTRWPHGGIYDQVGGGFARYSVDDAGSSPTSRRCSTTTRCSPAPTCTAGRRSGTSAGARSASETLDWALREMRGPEGGFYSALDADSEGEEGSFYVWTPDQIREVLAATGPHADEVIAYYGVTEAGNFEGAQHPPPPGRPGGRPPEGLRRRPRARSTSARRSGSGRASTTSGCLVERADDRRARRRRRRARPRRLPRRRAALRRVRVTRDARRATAACCAPGRTARRASTPTSRTTRTWSRRCYALRGDFEPRWFDAARETADLMIELFADPERGGFFTTATTTSELIARRKDVDDHPIPSGNSSAAYGLLRLAALTGEHEYERHGAGVSGCSRPRRPSHPQAVAHLLRAMDFHFAPVKEVALVAPARATAGRAGGGRRARASARTSWSSPAARRADERPELDARAHRGRRPARRRTSASTSPAGARSPTRRSSRRCSPAVSSRGTSSRWPLGLARWSAPPRRGAIRVA